MGIFELFLIGIGLSMDAFAVAICKGLSMRKIDVRQTVTVALFFGGFQALMPFLGWALGKQFEQYITQYDHWIAFVLLVYIGGKMLWEALHSKEEDTAPANFSIKELLILAIATSIDALAVGITFAFLNVKIGPAVAIIGCTTFVISLAGVLIGNKFGSRYKQKAEAVGGIILILIGLKILLEHTGILG